MAGDPEHRVRAFVPHVVAGVARPVLRLDAVVGKDAERRNDVLGEVLVLVVAPDDDDVRPEVVEQRARVAEVTEQALAMRGRRRGPAVLGVLSPHRLGPARGVTVALGQARVAQDGAQDVGHVPVVTGQRRVVRHAEAEDLAHEVVLPARACEACANPSLLVQGCQAIEGRASEPRAPGKGLTGGSARAAAGERSSEPTSAGERSGCTASAISSRPGTPAWRRRPRRRAR